MVRRYLGSDFDIHGGGLDLRFPHHENEQAQSRAAGDGFARYWLHHGWVTLGGEKMSKSLGNTALVDEVVKRVRPVELRYYLVASHYRSIVEYSDEALTESAAAYQRIENFVLRADRLMGGSSVGEVTCTEFAEAMDDDLAVPAALAALQGVLREGNKLLADGPSEAVAGALRSVRSMLDVLGLDPLSEHWAGAGGDGDLHTVVDRLVAVTLAERTEARARKDYATSDRIRDALSEAGIAVEDTPSGPTWSLTEGT
jgi:cysteinyl-tRNA synthetase